MGTRLPIPSLLKSRKVWAAVVVAAVLAAALPLLLVEWVAAQLTVAEPIDATGGDATAVLVLGYKVTSDAKPSPMLAQRVAAAAGVLSSGAAKTVVFSGGIPRWGKASEAEVMRGFMATCYGEALRSATRVILEANSFSTRDNAVRSFEMLRSEAPHIRRVILATNGFHQFRSVRVFQKAAGGDFEVVAAPGALTTPDDIVRASVSCPADTSGRVWGLNATASSVLSDHVSHLPSNANDHGQHTMWHSGRGADVQWLRLQVPEGTGPVCGYAIRSRRQECCAYSDTPVSWRVVTDAGEVDSVQGQARWWPEERRNFFLPEPVPVRWMQFMFQPGDRGYVVLADVELKTKCEESPAVTSEEPEAPRVWVQLNPIRILQSHFPWSWTADLAWEVSRELLAIALYFARGWM